MANSASLALPAHLDIAAAGPLKDRILAHRGRDLELDGSSVVRLGALCLQVLLAASRSWRRDGHIFRIVDPSHGLCEALRQMGAAPSLPKSQGE
jgi:chemotaxis protein CheX